MNRLAMLGGPPAVSGGSGHEWPRLDARARAVIAAALNSKGLYYGPDSTTRKFEENVAAYHGRRFALATDSGTTALLLAVLRVGPLQRHMAWPAGVRP